MKQLSFAVTPDVLELGVKIVTYRIAGLQNQDSDPDFDAYRDQKLDVIRKRFEGKKYKDDSVLAGFRDLHTKVGRSNRDYPASPEVLRKQFLDRDRFPHINLLVDIYNLVSLDTGLALGAHDVGAINGNVSLRLTTGNENFLPLGKSEPIPIFPGEYGYVDDDNNIICRLEVLQVEPTKVSTHTNDVFVIIQGNSETSMQSVEEGGIEVCRLITKYCGGAAEKLYPL